MQGILEYGENKEGYWYRDRMMQQMDRAIEVKYPPADGWRQVCVFDHSSCHNAMVDDALDDECKPWWCPVSDEGYRVERENSKDDFYVGSPKNKEPSS